MHQLIPVSVLKREQLHLHTTGSSIQRARFVEECICKLACLLAICFRHIHPFQFSLKVRAYHWFVNNSWCAHSNSAQFLVRSQQRSSVPRRRE